MSGGVDYGERATSDVTLEYGIGHDPRYRYLEQLILSLGLDPRAKILDIGSSFFTIKLTSHFENVSTLGLADAQHFFCKMPASIEHFAFDLNDSKEPSKWIELPKFDLIVFAEVIEHLPTAPEHVLRFLSSGLAEGGRIVVQTPNAVSLDKRLKMICGLNPYELIREEWNNPGHFREYTKSELAGFARACGLKVERHEFRSYFHSPRILMRLIDLVVAPFPRLRRGQTAILRLQSK